MALVIATNSKLFEIFRIIWFRYYTILSRRKCRKTVSVPYLYWPLGKSIFVKRWCSIFRNPLWTQIVLTFISAFLLCLFSIIHIKSRIWIHRFKYYHSRCFSTFNLFYIFSSFWLSYISRTFITWLLFYYLILDVVFLTW